MIELTVDSLAEKKIKQGKQLLLATGFPEQLPTDQLVYLYNRKQNFLGTAYMSKQNKGIGWFLSSQKIVLEEWYFVSLFQKAKVKRQSYYNDELTTAFRLFNQDGDNFGGLTVDLYGDYALFSWYNPFVFSLKTVILKAFKEVFPEVFGAYEKIRFKGLDYESSHLFGKAAPSNFTIVENGVRYAVFLNNGLMTGIFLDQHEVRDNLVQGLALGQSVLNLFSYTAAFSVAAAMGGALETTSVDLAKRSRELSKAHFEANGFDTSQHHLVVMDVFSYFKYAKKKGLHFDLIIIDPPSFARHNKQTFSVNKDYHELIRQALEILSPRGTIVASTNAANMTVQQFKKQLQKGLGTAKAEFVNFQQLPADFTTNPNDPASNYLKVYTIKVNL
ncbi:class I SAM-dependent rRNA methyltransferase [Streptococcus dentiloxodontae]